jgi:DNA-binding winged helix-turn-helix (wHTH) protein
VQFSPYAFNLKTGELNRSGIRLRLEIQPAKVLSLLIEAEGNLVSRAELIAALWPKEVGGDFDRRLDKAVAKLRARLNDNPVNPRFIGTLKGRGYYFLAEVTEQSANSNRQNGSPPGTLPTAIEPFEERPEEDILENLPSPSAPPSRLGVRPISIWRPAALVLLAAAVSLVAWRQHGKSVPSQNRHPTVLILEFRDTSRSLEDAWVSRSVAEWLSGDLNEGGELQLVQAGDNPELRMTTVENGCSELPPKLIEAARQIFNADKVVYGNYSSTESGASGDRWQLDVCLESPRGHNGPESMTVVGPRGDIGQLVFNAGEILRSKLGLKHLSNQSLGYLRASLPLNPAAARLYTEGTSALQHFEPEEASALLTEAAQLEPNHAAIHAALSTAWAALGYEGRSEQEAIIARDLAKGLSPTQQLEYQGLVDESRNDWPAASGEYTKLLGLHPDSSGYGLKLAEAQIHAGKAPLALETLRGLRMRSQAASNNPELDLTEAAADSAVSDYRGELAASKQAENRGEAQMSDLIVANARMQQGNADDMLGNWSDALRLWRFAGQRYESIGDRRGMVDALNRQAAFAWKKGDATNATKLFEESLAQSKAIGDSAGVAYALAHLGIVRMATERATGGGMPAAVEMFRHAASIYHTIGNAAEQGYVLSLIADEAMQRSQYEQAHAFYLQAMALSQAANDRSEVASRLLDLGIVAQDEGHASDAEQLFQRSSTEFDELGQKDRAAIARIRLGIALFRSGKVEAAESMLQDCLNIMRAFGRENQVREVLGDLTEVDILQNPAKAETLTLEGLKLDERLLGRPACAARYAQLADVELAQGKLQDAQAAIREAFLYGEKALAIEPLPNILLARGDVRISDHDYAGADADFERSLRMAQARSNRYIELVARLGLAEVHIAKKGASARPELDLVKRDANQLGYGIFAIKIDAFLHPIQFTK